MAKQNVKTVKITIPNEIVLKRINSTPSLNRLSRLILKVGENVDVVIPAGKVTFEVIEITI